MNRFPINYDGFRTFGEIVNDIFTDAPAQVNGFYPKTNITETKDNFEIEMLAPGRKKEDFKISLDKNLLTISFETKKEEKKEDKKMVSKEFSYQSFSRSFTFDDKIKSEDIVAKYEDGVLTLTLPKKEEVKEMRKEIAVQ